MSDVRLKCPTGLIVELYPEVSYREKDPFEDYEEYCQDIWDENVTTIVEPGPYDAKELRLDMLSMEQQDWLCIRNYLEAEQEKLDAAERATFKYKRDRVYSYGQRVGLCVVAFWSHVAEGVADGTTAAIVALKTNKTNVPATPLRWHVERVKNAWKGE